MLMTNEQVGVYIKLLCRAWINGGLPNDDTMLARLGDVDLDTWKSWYRGVDKGGYKGGYHLVIGGFQPDDKNHKRIVHPRMEEERQKLQNWKEKSSLGGKKSAAKRWGSNSRITDKGGYNMVKGSCNHRGNSTSTSTSTKYPPLPPLKKGEELCVLLKQKRYTRMSAAKKRTTRIEWPLDERMKLLADCFNRRHTTAWSVSELERFAEINPSLEECKLIKRFYALKDEDAKKERPNLWKSDLETLLNQWTQQLDRANQRVPHNANKPAEPSIPPEPPDFGPRFEEKYPEQAATGEWSWERLWQKHTEVAKKFL